MPRQQKHPSLADQLPVPVETITRRIFVIRGQKVMLDSDLAQLYQVPTKSLNLAVRRNAKRFPEDFMFQLSKEEFENLRLQIETSSSGHGGRRYPPYAFTEHGVAMLSSVLNSDRAVQMNILIIRAFVQLRELLATHKSLSQKIEKLEAGQRHQASVIAVVATEVSNLAKHINKQFKKLRDPRRTKRRPIGFYDRSEDAKK